MASDRQVGLFNVIREPGESLGSKKTVSIKNEQGQCDWGVQRVPQ